MIGIFMAPIIIGVIAAFIIPYVLHQVEIDKCQDSGGKFDYQNNRCIGEIIRTPSVATHLVIKKPNSQPPSVSIEIK